MRKILSLQKAPTLEYELFLAIREKIANQLQPIEHCFRLQKLMYF